MPLDEGIATRGKRPSGSGATCQRPPPSPRHGSEGVLALVNGVLAGVGGLYISTRSALITVVAALAAIVLTAIVLLLRR